MKLLKKVYIDTMIVFWGIIVVITGIIYMSSQIVAILILNLLQKINMIQREIKKIDINCLLYNQLIYLH